VSKTRYSAFKVLKEALTGHKGWEPTWRDAEPKADGYDVIIVGGGGHGLATAYYLAKNHGITNVAVLEKGWIGGGNVGRNTTIIRSNYLLPGNEPFYELSLQLWENLEQDLNYNAMVSQRGIMNLIHSRFPIKAALAQPRGGTVRHDAVAWGYARGASDLGVDIIQNCEVTGFNIENGKCLGVQTSKGEIKAGRVGVCVAGSSGRVMAKAGIKLPIESHVLQAFVTEGLKPVMDNVITFGAGHFYCSQSDKGGLVFGGDIDGYNTYAQRGNLPVVEDVCSGGMAIMPSIGRARLLRMWGGIMDMSMDGSPFIDSTEVEELFFNGGWCYGGFKATPASGYCYAHLLATNNSHEVASAYKLDRFRRGAIIDEKGVGAQPNLH
jgi:sarcosine oxidase subunit beta